MHEGGLAAAGYMLQQVYARIELKRARLESKEQEKSKKKDPRIQAVAVRL